MIRCELCSQPLDPLARSTLQKIEGWERKAGTRWTGTHGGSDIRARRQLQVFAHETCVDRVRDGIDPNQGTLV